MWHCLNLIYYFSDLTMKDSMFGNLTKDAETKSKIRKISENEWEVFLVNRAKELAAGKINTIVLLPFKY